jgi:ribosomal protein L20
MTALLKRLLPLHDVRQRRAQRQFHEDSLAYEQSLSDQMQASKVVVGLEQSRDSELRQLLSTELQAAQAHAGIEYTAYLGVQVGLARERVQAAVQDTARALELARTSRKAYLRQVRVNHMLRQASKEQLRQLSISRSRADELRQEDEFACTWQTSHMGQRQTQS